MFTDTGRVQSALRFFIMRFTCQIIVKIFLKTLLLQCIDVMDIRSAIFQINFFIIKQHSSKDVVDVAKAYW